jgi:hypothetical protein
MTFLTRFRAMNSALFRLGTGAAYQSLTRFGGRIGRCLSGAQIPAEDRQ